MLWVMLWGWTGCEGGRQARTDPDRTGQAGPLCRKEGQAAQGPGTAGSQGSRNHGDHRGQRRRHWRTRSTGAQKPREAVESCGKHRDAQKQGGTLPPGRVFAPLPCGKGAGPVPGTVRAAAWAHRPTGPASSARRAKSARPARPAGRASQHEPWPGSPCRHRQCSRAPPWSPRDGHTTPLCRAAQPWSQDLPRPVPRGAPDSCRPPGHAVCSQPEPVLRRAAPQEAFHSSCSERCTPPAP